MCRALVFRVYCSLPERDATTGVHLCFHPLTAAEMYNIHEPASLGVQCVEVIHTHP